MKSIGNVMRKLIFKDLRNDYLSVTHLFVPEQYGIICSTASYIHGTRWLWVMSHIPVPLFTEKSPSYTLHRRLGGLWRRAAKFWGRKGLIRPIFWDSNAVSSFIQPVASLLDWPGYTVFVLNYVNPSAWGHLNPSSYCDVGRLFYGVFKLWSKLQRKKWRNNF